MDNSKDQYTAALGVWEKPDGTLQQVFIYGSEHFEDGRAYALVVPIESPIPIKVPLKEVAMYSAKLTEEAKNIKVI
jgi:hypothetical protein